MLVIAAGEGAPLPDAVATVENPDSAVQALGNASYLPQLLVRATLLALQGIPRGGVLPQQLPRFWNPTCSGMGVIQQEKYVCRDLQARAISTCGLTDQKTYTWNSVLNSLLPPYPTKCSKSAQQRLTTILLLSTLIPAHDLRARTR